ncbi:hypothetical protein CPB85DRAFT_1555886 [Mucidula mucida]|nr:hypothetical protein CPB85DRAFT_1555886 [Mucidula mucida]
MFPSKPLQIAFCATSLLMNLIAPAVASPYTLPLPLAKRATPQSSVNPKALPNTSITYRQIPREPMPFPIDVDQPVRRYSLSDMVASLRLSSLHLQYLASQARSAQENDADFQQECLSTLLGYQGVLSDCKNALAPLGADRGLANYDNNNDMETALKNIINVSKDVLSSISEMTDCSPLVGPLLGPTVYDIKCILESILDLFENVTDGLLNDLSPSFSECLGGYGNFVCGPGGLNIAGLCINVDGVLVAIGL